mgnify:CR=1 FL=1
MSIKNNIRLLESVHQASWESSEYVVKKHMYSSLKLIKEGVVSSQEKAIDINRINKLKTAFSLEESVEKTLNYSA